MSTFEQSPEIKFELEAERQASERQVELHTARRDDGEETVLMEMRDGSTYDIDIPVAMMRHLPDWYYQIPWEKSKDQELPQPAIDSLHYMARVEGYVCGGYLPILLASPRIRAKTRSLDFVVGAWAPDENGHSVALYTFLDLYHSRSKSSRAHDLDTRKEDKPLREQISETLLPIAAHVVPDTFNAAYSVIGYRNELMTLRGYASLRSKANADKENEVLSPMLHSIMNEEKDHAKEYKGIAKAMLTGEPKRRETIRKFLKKWPGIVGEGFGGSGEADKVLGYLFEDASGRDMIGQVDTLVGKLPGLEGMQPTRIRLEQALANLALQR